jgi:hypothetical protein
MNNAAEIVRDYQVVRNVGLALAALAFFVGLAKLGTDSPYEHARAQGILIQAATVFLLLAGDRILIHGIAQWFGLPASSIPVFWQ